MIFQKDIKGKYLVIAMLVLLASMTSNAGLMIKKWQLKSMEFSDFVEYEVVKPAYLHNSFGAQVWMYSKSKVKKLPVKIEWDETLLCDKDPEDGWEDFSYYASSYSSRRYTEIIENEGVWPLKNPLDVIIRGPDVPSACFLESVMTVHVGYGVSHQSTYNTGLMYFSES